MASYWLRDPAHGVVGPISLSVAKDLIIRHQFPRTSQVSTDGKAWRSLQSLEELRAVFRESALPERHAKEMQEAQRIRLQLDRFEELPLHELFGVPRSSTVEIYRQAFRSMAATYDPGKLPSEVHRDLKQAHSELFDFLSERMRRIEGRESSAPPAPPTPKALPPRLSEVVTLGRNRSGRLAVWMRVTPEKLGIFTDHRLVNLGTCGAFINTSDPLPLGTQFELTFHFGPPPKDIQARGIVVLENALDDPKQVPGFGVRLERLTEEAKSYIGKAIAAAAAAQQAK